MAGSANQDNDEPISAINVTPLVDIVLVLLIIMMVTANYIASKTLPLEVPKVDGGVASQTPQQLSISIDRQGLLYLDAERIEEPALRSKIVAAHRANPDTRVVIAADRQIAYDYVANAIDLVRCPERDAPQCRSGLTKMALNVRPRGPEETR